MQWEQLRYALEAHRRLGERCAGSCLWHLGEPIPNLMDTCTVDSSDQPKPAYYGEAKAFSPLHLSAHYDSVIHNDVFTAEFALANSTDKSFSGKIRAEIYNISGERLFSEESECYADTDTVTANAMSISFTNLPDGLFFLRQSLIDANGKTIETGYSIHSTKEKPYRDLMLQESVTLDSEVRGDSVILTNKGDKIISALTVSTDNSDRVFFSDGCIMLLPGETATVNMSYEGDAPTLYVSGFGVPYRKC
jgi:beta-mannosidase